MRRVPDWFFLAAVVGLTIFLAGCPPYPFGTTFDVVTSEDAIDANPGDGVCASALPDGACSLRAAIDEINALEEGQAYQIVLRAGDYYEIRPELTSMEINVDGEGRRLGGRNGLHLVGDRQVSIQHSRPSKARITLAQGSAGRIFTVWGAHLTLLNLILENGNAVRDGADLSSSSGGAIYADRAGRLTLIGCDFVNNSAFEGGAIRFGGSTLGANWIINYEPDDPRLRIFSEIRDGKFSGNSASYGGAIYYSGSRPVKIINSEFEDNYATNSGGAVFMEAKTTQDNRIMIQKSKFFYNTARNGGAITIRVLEYVNAAIVNSIFSGNQAYWLPYPGYDPEPSPGVAPLEGGYGSVLLVEGVTTSELYAGPVLIAGSTIFGNFAELGGGLANWTSNAHIVVQASIVALSYRARWRGIGQGIVQPLGTGLTVGPLYPDADFISNCYGTKVLYREAVLWIGGRAGGLPGDGRLEPDCDSEFLGLPGSGGGFSYDYTPDYSQDPPRQIWNPRPQSLNTFEAEGDFSDPWNYFEALRKTQYRLRNDDHVRVIDGAWCRLVNLPQTEIDFWYHGEPIFADAYGTVRPKDGGHLRPGGPQCDIGATEWH